MRAPPLVEYLDEDIEADITACSPNRLVYSLLREDKLLTDEDRRAAAGRALRPVAEAEARERAFICTASHDLVTPLMAVTANCDVLEAEASDQAGLASWVANIRAAADEMATHIADMLMHMGGD